MTDECLHTIYDAHARIVEVDVPGAGIVKVCVPLMGNVKNYSI